MPLSSHELLKRQTIQFTLSEGIGNHVSRVYPTEFCEPPIQCFLHKREVLEGTFLRWCLQMVCLQVGPYALAVGVGRKRGAETTLFRQLPQACCRLRAMLHLFKECQLYERCIQQVAYVMQLCTPHASADVVLAT